MTELPWPFASEPVAPGDEHHHKLDVIVSADIPDSLYAVLGPEDHELRDPATKELREGLEDAIDEASTRCSDIIRDTLLAAACRLEHTP